MRMRFKLYTYDLIADCEGGYSVNDVYPQGTITINVRPTTVNPGTQWEAIIHSPSDRQLNQAIGARDLTWDGESDYTLYATDRKGNPACELRRIS